MAIEHLKSEYARSKDELKDYLKAVKRATVSKDKVTYFYARND